MHTAQRFSGWRIAGMLAAAGVVALTTAGPAAGEPAPDPCAPAAVMRAHAAAMSHMADYLDSHPDVAQVFVDARGQGTPQQRHDVIEAYVDAHPDVAAAFRDIHQPVQELSVRCGLPTHPGMPGGGPMGPGR